MRVQLPSFLTTATRAVLLVVTLALTLSSTLRAQHRNIRFDHISLEQGLSQITVFDVIQDRVGFMWFATQEGLNRYDGREIVVFKSDPEDSSSLSHSYVYDLLEDDAGRLWVGTYGGGLNLWDPAERGFRHFRNEPGNPASLSDDWIRVLLADPDGTLWIGTEKGGLNRFDPATESFTRFLPDPTHPSGTGTDHIGDDYVMALCMDRDGMLWIGTYEGGLTRLDPATEEFRHYRHERGDSESLTAGPVRAIFEDREGNLWIGTYEGLNRFDRTRDIFHRFEHDPDDPSSLSSNHVRTIRQDDAGTLWIGTEAGLNEWLPATQGFLHYRHRPSDAHSLSDDKVTSIYQDRGGVLWVGTLDGGLNKWNSRASFTHFEHDPEDSTSLSSNSVMSFSEDRDGHLWVGTNGGGLNRLDRRTGKFTHYRYDPNDPESLTDDRVMSLLVDTHDDLWVGTLAGGLHRLDLDTNTFHRYPHDPDNSSTLASNGIISIYEDSEQTVWLGTYQGGLSRFDRHREAFFTYRHVPSDPTSLSHDVVHDILEHPPGTFWVATAGGGVNRFDRQTERFTSYRHELGSPRSLSSDMVFSLHLGADGSLWMGTDRGLSRWSREDRDARRAVFERYTEQDGLPSNNVYGILSDEEGTLWLSTVKGLARLDVDSKTFQTFDISHGTQSNEFNFGAYYRGSDGQMFFGGVNGFNAFFPEHVKRNDHVPPVVLTRFLKLNRRVLLDRPIWETEAIELGWRDYVVSFEFAALDYTAPEQNRYAYQLEGLDESWNEVGNLQRATYTNLAGGDYVLRVRGSNSDGVWNEDGTSLRIRVHPPPWKTWWAYSLYLISLCGLAFAYVRAQKTKLRREEEHSRRLEKEVAQRTEELARSNEDLHQANSALEEANQALESANRELQEVTLTDSLTGLRNRRYLMTYIKQELAVAERHYSGGRSDAERRADSADFAFIMVDLDGFKQINDLHGHDAGDKALVAIRSILERATRKSDTIIRWGGDEFLVVGRSVRRPYAERMAARIRDAVQGHEFDVGIGHPVRMGASVGLAFYPFLPTDPSVVSGEQVVTIADEALYVAKTSGRNAWVAIYGNERTEPRDVERLIGKELAQLVLESRIEVRSSIEDPSRLNLSPERRGGSRPRRAAERVVTRS